MKTKHLFPGLIFLVVCLFISLAFTLNHSKTSPVVNTSENGTTLCLVCGMKVDTNSSYDFKYKGKIYHFDSFDCRSSFKMDPEKFIKNVCTPVK